jgi:hypothetical protein
MKIVAESAEDKRDRNRNWLIIGAAWRRGECPRLPLKAALLAVSHHRIFQDSPPNVIFNPERNVSGKAGKPKAAS